jgi:hypothetical protein
MSRAGSEPYDDLGRVSAVTNPLGAFTDGYMGATGLATRILT